MTEMTDLDAKQVSDELLYDGFFQMKRYRFRHRLFAGGWAPEVTREVFERQECVSVLPYDPAQDKVVLIEQFRPGPMAAGDKEPWITEIIAGIAEADETLEDVARREAMEEAGCEIGEMEAISSHYVSPGGSTEVMHIFCGLTDSNGIGGIYGLESEGEDIRVFTEPFEDAYRRVKQGSLRNSFTIIALQWLALNRERLAA
ncbi:MAG TPA: ADP-ribose diphosphatase [Rhodospirillaceae bacterium]|nr:ADP-ribose diphosphatase [Rhodospirillaceae bacterium]HAT35464.1 ADP-ribose diphosphatase [Rhodospirillaceae bacterium]